MTATGPSRRQVLAWGLTAAAAGAAAPLLVACSKEDHASAPRAEAAPDPAPIPSADRAATGRRALVVVELSGGNDGLSTLVPHRDRRYRRARPTTALAGVGLEGFADVPTRQLSAGQKKRVALARVLLAPVGLWLLDEPYANLDLDGIKLVNRLLELHARRGGAALITSHGAYAFTSGTPRRIPLRGTLRGRVPAEESRSDAH